MLWTMVISVNCGLLSQNHGKPPEYCEIFSCWDVYNL